MKHRFTTKALSLLLALVMVLGMFPASVLAADGVDDSLVTDLAKVYEEFYGDEDDSRAREDLNALYEARLINADGSMVSLDIRAGGVKTDLADLVSRITSGEDVGDITVNGNNATAEQILQIQQVDTALEIVRLLDDDVEITDEHVANLESLLTGIADGSIDLSSALESGTLKSTALRSAAPAGLLMDANDANAPAIPATGTDQGALTSGNTFTGRYIGSDGKYETSHSFALADETVKNYYTDSRYDGMPTLDGTVTITMNSNGTSATANLDKAQSVPVTFEWKVGGVATPASGTVRWEAGQSGNKGISWSLDQNLKWKGERMVVLNTSNLLNASFKDGKTSYTVAVNQNTKEDELYPGAWRGVSATGREDVVEELPYWQYYNETEWSYAAHHRYVVKVSGFNADGNDIYLKVKAHNLGTGHKGEKSYAELLDKDKKSFASQTVSNDAITFNLRNTDYASKLFDGQLYMRMHHWYNMGIQISTCWIDSVQIFRLDRPTSASVKSISVPEGEYRPGEMIPITVEFDQTVKSTSGTKLKVNNSDCTVLDKDVSSKKLTFGYTVKDSDGVAVNVGEVSGVKNFYGDAMTISNNAGKSIGAAENVSVISGNKVNNLNLNAAKWGVDDAAAGSQTMTIVVPLTGSNLAWAGNEAVKIPDEDGQPVSVKIKLPDYGDVELTHYVPSAYFSMDEGLTRYPAYLLTQGQAETPAALVGRFAVPVESGVVRKSTLNLFMFPYLDSNPTKFLPEWTSGKTDMMGYQYFTCGKDKTGKSDTAFTYSISGVESAPLVKNTQWDFYVKGPVYFSDTEYVTRTQEYEEVDGGFIKLKDANAKYPYIMLNDPQNPDHQYDVELMCTEDMYNVVMKGLLRGDDFAAGDKNYGLSFQCSNRKNFTYTDLSNFTWAATGSGDDGALRVTVGTDEQGNPDPSKASLMVDPGVETPISKSTIALQVHNGVEADLADNDCQHYYELALQPVGYSEGTDPFLLIPETSKNRTTLTGMDTDIFFASNFTKRNQDGYEAAKGKGETPLTFTLTLIKVSEYGSEEQVGDFSYTVTGNSTVSKMLSYLTVPGSRLNDPGVYMATISGTLKYENDGTPANLTLSDKAWITVKQGPAKITLEKLSSYSATEANAPKYFRYYITSGDAYTEVEYTIQKSGEEVSERMKPEELGYIDFTAATPEGIKDVYTITVYGRNKAEDPWSMDSLRLTVYNSNLLKLLVNDVVKGQIGGTTGGTGTSANGTTVTMDNTDKVAEMTSGSQIDFSKYYSSLDEMRADIGLQEVISINYGDGVWGMLSDRMQWASSDPDKVSVDYEQGGFYSDIRNYNYTSYAPATDFLLVGKSDTAEDETVQITATHAGSGMSATLNVKVNTLTDKLYVFKFYPQAKTTVTYTTKNNVSRTLESSEQGELVVYEPDGISGPVMAISTVDDVTYAGTIFNNALETGEKDIAALQLYPCNNLIMKPISGATLTFLTPDGEPYNGSVTLRGGVYKNNVYCPDASFKVNGGGMVPVRGSETVKAKSGQLSLGFDVTSFRTGAGDLFRVGDRITYVIEYSFDSNEYEPGYAMIYASTDIDGEANASDSVVRLQKVVGSATSPQVIKQTLTQYHGETGNATATSDVFLYTENVGISAAFPKAKLVTVAAMPGESVTAASINNYTSFAFEDGKKVDLELRRVTADGDSKLTGQTENGNTATVITNLSMLDIKSEPEQETTVFVFPFSSVPMLRTVYTMTNDDMEKDGITDTDKNNKGAYEAQVRAIFTKSGMTVRTTSLPFNLSNLSHQTNLATNGDTKTIGKEIKTDISKQMDIGAIFKQINVNDIIKTGFAFLGGITSVGGDNPISLMILPTEDPATFRIMALLGQKASNSDEDGLSINDDPAQAREDWAKFQQEMEKDDDEDEDEGGEGKLTFNFYGALILEARLGIKDGKWKISFVGGSVGANVKGSYEWSQTFMCGPVPFLISFEVGFHTDVEVAFCSKDAVRAMLLDAAVGVSIEAFAGLGFDLSIMEFKLGIFGKISADVNFKYLTAGNKTGTKLDIAGEIGLQFKVKVLFISYSKTLASTGFNWTKKWNSYDAIGDYWENNASATLMGVTQSGRPYSLQLFKDGTALVTIDDGGRIEDRDYLSYEERSWNNGAPAQRRLMFRALKSTPGLTSVLGNSYPYAEPTFIDDGSMFLYIDDNKNDKKPETVISYAVYNGSGYDNIGRLDNSEDNILADSSISASGTAKNAFAAWVKMMEEPKKEMKQEAGGGDLGMMINSTEIYAGVYKGEGWNVQRITENFVGDMSPVVASSGEKAILAWRSLNASSMPEGNEELSTAFNVENYINYSIYNSETNEWSDAQVAYNGTTGSVTAVDAAMLPDGTAILVYTVRTGSAATSSETFYTVIDADGNVITSGRLTNDDYSDINAQVVTVGNQFVIGWYSEHETSGETAHDIRLARVNANGSTDATFPESVGGSAGASADADFRFSAPAVCESIDQLSIVWSQRKESAESSASSQYEISGVKFFQKGNTLGVSLPNTLLTTAEYVTVDEFDAYTDQNGAVNVIVLASDYSNTKLNEFDTIDLNQLEELGVELYQTDSNPAADKLEILEQQPVARIMQGKGSFPNNAIEAEANFNIFEVTPGLSLPVQFTVTNSGTATITEVNAEVDGKIVASMNGLNLLPGQSVILTGYYQVPAAVKNVDYTVTAGEATESGTLTLNRPDVGIAEMNIIREEDGERDIQVVLTNEKNIPLTGSGKTVELSFYRDSARTDIIKTITIDADKYTLIDNGNCPINATLTLAEILGKEANEEIPAAGALVYAYVEVKDTEELNTNNNISSVNFRNLKEKNGGKTTTEDASLQMNANGGCTVYADVRSTIVAEQDLGILYAVLQNADGETIAEKQLNEGKHVVLGTEERKNLSVDFTAAELNGATPDKVVLAHAYKITFNANAYGKAKGCFLPETETPVTDEELHTKSDGKLKAEEIFTASALKVLKAKDAELLRDGYFEGWYTKASGGNKIDENTVFTDNVTVYAHYTEHKHNYTYEVSGSTITITCANEDGKCFLDGDLHDGVHHATVKLEAPGSNLVYDGVAHPATLTYGNDERDLLKEGLIKGEITYKKDDKDWSRDRLSYAGHYVATFTLEKEDTKTDDKICATVEYDIAKYPLTVNVKTEISEVPYTGLTIAQYMDKIRNNPDYADIYKNTWKIEKDVYVIDGMKTEDNEYYPNQNGEVKTGVGNETLIVSFKERNQQTNETNKTIREATLPGDYDYEIEVKDSRKGITDNYDLTINQGKITIQNPDHMFEVKFVGKSQELEYDGLQHVLSGLQIKTKTKDKQGDLEFWFAPIEGGSEVKYTLVPKSDTKPENCTASVSGTNVGTYQNVIVGTPQIIDAVGHDVTNLFNVKLENGTLTIKPREITIISASLEKDYDGTPLTNGNSAVKFKDDKGFVNGQGATYAFNGSVTLPNAQAENSFVHMLNPGTDRENYKITKQFGTLKIKNREAPYAIKLTPNSDTVLYDGKEHEVSGFTINEENGITPIDAPEGKTGDGWFKLENGSIFQLTGLSASVKQTNAGDYTVSITGTPVITDINGNHQDASETPVELANQFNIDTSTTGKLTISKRKVTLTSATDTKVYDGTALKNETVTVAENCDGWAEGETPTYSSFPSMLLPGPAIDNTFEVSLQGGKSLANYEITKVNGKLEVTGRKQSGDEGYDEATNKKYEITVTAYSGEFKYNGEEKTVSGWTIDGVAGGSFTAANGLTYTVEGITAEVKATDAGTYTVAITGTPVVKDSENNDVTAQFIVNKTNGTMTISKRSVTLTSATPESREYDGTALTDNTVTVSVDGWADGEGATYNVTGTQTLVGSSDNSFTYELNEGTKANNYDITTVPGTLTVTTRSAPYKIVPVAKSETVLYDGKSHSVEGFEETSFTVNGQTFTLEGLTAAATGTDAGTYTVSVTGTPVVKDSNANDVSAQFSVVPTTGTLTITKRSVTLTSATAEKDYDETALTNDNVTVGGDGFAEGEGATYTVTGTRTLVGVAENSFTYELNEGTKAENYNISTILGGLTVNNGSAQHTVTLKVDDASYVYDGTEKTVSSFTINGVAGGNFEYNEKTYTITGMTASTGHTDVGEYSVVLTGTPVVKDSDGNDASDLFNVTEVPGTMTITKRSVTLTSATEEKEYDGKALTNNTVTVGGDGFASGEGATYNVTGTQTQVGFSTNSFTYTLNDNTKASNYDITTVPGTLTVKNRDAKYEITVTAKSESVTYDGKLHTVSGFTAPLTYTFDGVSYTVSGLTATVTGTDAGTYTVNVNGTAVVKDSEGKDVSDQFSVTSAAGTLTITKRSVTLTSATAEKDSDGTALTNSEVTVSGDGFAEGEGATYNVTGTQTEPGVSENSFDYTLNEGTKAANYSITKIVGMLTVINSGAQYEVTLQANSKEFKYDGTEKTVNGFTIVGVTGGSFNLDDVTGSSFKVDGETYTVSGMEATLSQPDAGTYSVNFTGTPVVKDSSDNDVTANFAVKVQSGTMTITKRSVILTSATPESKEYDGTALTNSEVTVSGDGWAGDDGATYNVTGSQTIPGTSSNSFTYTLNANTKADNYDISTSYGTLEVTTRNAKYEITVTATSESLTYDGKPHTITGFTIGGVSGGSFTVGNDVTYTVSGLNAYVTGTDTGIYPVTVTGTPVIKDKAGNDLTGEFIVHMVNGSLSVGKRSVTLTSPTKQQQYNGKALTDNAVTATGDGWADGEGATYNVTGSQTLVGSSDNSFTYELNANTKADNYIITTSIGTLTVTNRDAKYEISPKGKSGEFKYDGTEKSVSGLETSTFTVEGSTYTVSGLNAYTVGKDAKAYTVSVTGTAVVTDAFGNDVTDQFSVTPTSGTLTITKREVTLTSSAGVKEYDGTALTNDTVTVTGDGWADGEGATYNVTGTRTLAGSSENTFTYNLNAGTKADNYNITTNYGTLTINNRNTKYNVVLKADSGEYKYDGTEKTVTGWTINGVAGGSFTATNGLTYTVSGMVASLSKTDAGTYTVNVTGTPVVKDSGDNDVTAQFAVNVQPGTLKINKRSLTLTSATDSKVYDGTALTNSTVTVTGEGFVTGEGATYNMTGSQTLPGNGTNTFNYVFNSGTKAENYDITKVEGTLTVSNRTDEGDNKKYEITVKANSDTVDYDGEAHTVSGFETLEFTFNGVDYTVSGLNAYLTGTDAGIYSVAVTGTAVVKDAADNDLTEQFIVKTVNGSLTINKVEITGAMVSMGDYAYGESVPAPAIVSDGTEGSNAEAAAGGATYYYQATAFLKSQTEDLDKLAKTEGVFTELTPTTFEPGTHYVLAVISGKNYSNTYITQSVFKVTKNTETVRTAPAAPAVDGTKVTVDEADRGKSLEYSLDGQTWLPVELNEKGEFTAKWANPVTDAELQLREKADDNYAKESAVATSDDENKVTITTITVTYDANGGVNAPAAETVQSDRGVTVAGRMTMTRKGYTFTGWNTEADGTGTAYKAGDKLSTGLTLYAQWEANTYKVSFNANGGKGTMDELELKYDETQTLPANTFEREAPYVFLGWSLTANGRAQYQDAKSVKNLAESGNVTLYAVWAKDLYNVYGTIKSEHTGDITLQLVQGNIVYDDPKTVQYNTEDEEVSFMLDAVPAGTYNLLAKQGDVTMTSAVIVTDEHVMLDLITMPNGETSSVVKVSGVETPAIVVGGLDVAAADEAIEDRMVLVTIMIETQNETKAAKAGEAIINESRAQNVEFIDFTVTKALFNNGVEESTETMTETKSVIELIIPFDFSGKTGINLYRYHDGEIETLKQARGNEANDGTYSFDQRNGYIHVFTSKFSTYGITYNTYSGSFVSDFETVIAETEHGTITVEPEKAQAGDEVVITATPDAGYKLAELTVKDANGNEVELTKNENGTYSFTQPDGEVTIEGKFIVKFVDVPADSYYEKAVDWAVLNGITNGIDETHFAPDATCTRAQAVTFLWRALGCPEPTTAKSEFSDVAEGTFYYKAVLWATENGITLGYGNGTFGVNDTVNRGQMVTFMERAMKGKANKAESFTDVPEGAFYADAAAWAKENGISEGIGEGKFGGEIDCLRAQIVTMLYRYFAK